VVIIQSKNKIKTKNKIKNILTYYIYVKFHNIIIMKLNNRIFIIFIKKKFFFKFNSFINISGKTTVTLLNFEIDQFESKTNKELVNYESDFNFYEAGKIIKRKIKIIMKLYSLILIINNNNNG